MASHVGSAAADQETATVIEQVLQWYATAARDLPWRRPEATPWQILVSEFMLQQTPVSRVLEPWRAWVTRWPTAAALAETSSGEAVRAWGRLGYPRRALRLHASATAIVERHGGEVPSSLDALQRLPGVGAYTAAAVASFAFGQRHVVIDTNVRRVLARIATGTAPAAAPTAAERAVAAAYLPAEPATAARWAVAAMELGALVCTARSPRCGDCPVAAGCRWHSAGQPVWSGPARRAQAYAGTDRQCRGALLAVLRAQPWSATVADLAVAWPEPEQRQRCLQSLVLDGLAEPAEPGSYRLPGAEQLSAG